MVYIRDGSFRPDECKDSGFDKDSCFAAQHPKPKKIFLECGFNPQDAVFDIDYKHVKCDQAFVLDRVIVDTTCLFRPFVKIEFSSLIVFEAEGEGYCEKEIEAELLFELERNCNGHKEIVQSWLYKKEVEVKTEKLELEISEPFTVTFCDRTCPGCCEYKMIVKGKKFEGEFKALRVAKPNLSALAQGSCGE
jgi:hypothetical protein